MTRTLYMTDHNKMSGFGYVADKVCDGLARKYGPNEVWLLGWGLRSSEPINRGSYGVLSCADHPYGADVLPSVLNQIQPEILITQDDTRNLLGWFEQFADDKSRQFHWINYPVCDGYVWQKNGSKTKWPSNWVEFMKKADYTVAMSEFGGKILKANGIENTVIPHGVETEMFKPIPPEIRNTMRTNNNLGDKFVVLGVFKNMSRKMPDKWLQTLRLFKEDKKDVVGVIHCNPAPEFGGEFNMFQIAIDYGLEIGKDVIFSNVGIPRQAMVGIYGMADCFLHTGFGEGFGLPVIEAMACLPEGEEISTFQGSKPINMVSVGDSVYSKTGDAVVLQTFSRKYVGDVINIKPLGSLPFKVTENHPILIYDSKESNIPRWIRADELKQGNFLSLPRERRINNMRFSFKETERGHALDNREMILDENLSWFFGWYVAEGWSHKCTVGLSLGENDSKYITRIQTIVRNYFDRSACLSKSNKNIRLSFGHAGLARLLKGWFGISAKTKHIPPELLLADEQMIKSFLDGYLRGDGHFEPKRQRWQASTVSRSLAIEIQSMFAKIGVFVSISKQYTKEHFIGNRKIPNGYKYSINIPAYFNRAIATNRFRTKVVIDKFDIRVPVKELSRVKYIGNVYNIQTTDGTFTTPFVIHNCGLPVIGTNSSTAPELIGDCGLLIDTVKYPKSNHEITFGSYNGVEFSIPNIYDAVEKLNKLYNNKLLREELSIKSCQKAVTKFDWSIIIPQWEEVVKKATGIDALPEEWQRLVETIQDKSQVKVEKEESGSK